ncbi:ankyrin repeat protein [Pandoravirus inopinatum]|uniref:Ankyrin repeat protein n=1 Tax=Pandoravirus inopinatum TaxID=1605721 RepID=A0A0B5J132_9VIRU|nr:ankyrin repeat protein [Pandoravirus inopinatum]AJF97149.1 ankyrin repeat protein [Pandoravirus inopinatum]
MSAEGLPNEILGLVFSWVPCLDVRRTLALVSRQWASVAGDTRATGRRSCVGPKSRRRTLCHQATAAGHVDCLAYARSRGRSWGVNVCAAAAAGGHLTCLEYAHTNGCPWDEHTPKAAAAGGHLDCLEYAHHNGCPWDGRTCDEAAKGGHVACLAYATSMGCVCGRDTWMAAAAGGSTECLDIIESHSHWTINEVNGGSVYAAAAGRGHIVAIDWIMSRGAWDAFALLKGAARHGRIDCLVYLLDRGLGADSCYGDDDADVVAAAARGGHVDCLRVLIDNGFSVGVSVSTAAARGGHIDCLRYLRDAHTGAIGSRAKRHARPPPPKAIWRVCSMRT